MKRPSLAFFTPLNPQRTGIADYSEELLPYLGELADIDLVVGPYTPENSSLAERFGVITPDEFLARSSVYDAVIYQVGNNYNYHAYMVPCMQAVPGIVVLHDYSLSYLTLGLTLQRGDIRSVKRALARARHEHPTVESIKLLLSLADPYQSSLVAPVVDMSTVVAVHSRYAAGLLNRDFPEKRAEIIPMGIAIEEDSGMPEGLRESYGLGADDFVVLSVGSLAFNKRLDLVLRSLGELKAAVPRLRYVIVGGGPLGAKARRMIRDLGLTDTVRQLGWVAPELYRDTIRVADVVIDMRYPSAGETSASVLRAMEAGKPLILSAHGFFNELPDSCSIKIDPGDGEVEGIKGAIAALADDRERCARMGAAGREFILSGHSLEHAAAAYVDLVRRVSANARTGSAPGFSPPRIPAFEKAAVSTIYKAFRLAYLYRHYGLGDTLRRIKRELKPGG